MYYKCNRKYGGGIRPECKECTSRIRKENYDPKRQKNQVLKRFYGINLQEYNKMLKNQQGTCKICNSKPKYKKSLSVDHCHKTGKVRGLLCGDCNTGLGKFRDNIDSLKNAIKYLKDSYE